MLKRGLILFVFLLSLQVSSAQTAQQDSCLAAHPTNVPIVARNILQTYSQIYDDEEKAVEAALDSLNRWNPENVDPNWVNFKNEIGDEIRRGGLGEEINVNKCKPEDDIDDELVVGGITSEDGTILSKSNFETIMKDKMEITLSLFLGSCKYKDCELSCLNKKIILPNLKGYILDLYSEEKEDQIIAIVPSVGKIYTSGSFVFEDLDPLENIIAYDGESITLSNPNKDYKNKELLRIWFPFFTEFDSDGFISDQYAKLSIYKDGENMRHKIVTQSPPAFTKTEIESRSFTVRDPDIKIYYADDETSEKTEIPLSAEIISDEIVNSYKEVLDMEIRTETEQLNPELIEEGRIPIIYYYGKVLFFAAGGGEAEIAVSLSEGKFRELFSGITAEDLNNGKLLTNLADRIMSEEPVRISISGRLLRLLRVPGFKQTALHLGKNKIKGTLKDKENFDLGSAPEWNAIDDMIGLADAPFRLEIERDESGINTLKLYDEQGNFIASETVSKDTIEKLFNTVSGKYNTMIKLRDRLLRQFLMEKL